MKPFELHVGLTRSTQSPPPGSRRFKQVCGGPEVLIDWLETQLGLGDETINQFERRAEYLQLVEEAPTPAVRESFNVDPWATAADLLDRRDELMLGGWNGAPAEGMPELVEDLARIEQSGEVPAGIPDRLHEIREALNQQLLPEHTCYLQQASRHWPALWRSVLDNLNCEVKNETVPASASATSLQAIQASLLEGTQLPPITPDSHFDYVRTHSRHRGCVLLAEFLQDHSDRLEEITIVCPESTVRNILDRTLRKRGFPSTGSGRLSKHQPLLQVLPLSLEMLWEPVDPRTLMDFLVLPRGPIPNHVARGLADALAEMPGLGSDSWRAARAEAVETAEDSEQMEEKLAAWFDHPRIGRGEDVPVELVGERCNLIAAWARGWAERLEGDNSLEESLSTAASVASTFKSVVRRQGKKLSKPQLDRILEDVQESLPGRREFEPTGAGPVVVDDLSDIPPTCKDLIWLGVAGRDFSLERWTQAQAEALGKENIEVNHARRRRPLERQSQVRGLARVKESVTVVEFTGGEETSSHPLWLRLANALPPGGKEENSYQLQNRLGEDKRIGPWRLRSREKTVEPSQTERTLFELPGELLFETPTSSATELTERLGCPARWTFNRIAGLKTSSAASLPRLFRLKGRLAHQLFERIFGEGDELPAPGEAARAVEVTFDDYVKRNAAPLDQPAKRQEKQQFKEELATSARKFIEVLNRGNYEITGIELPIEASYADRPLKGFIDCVLQRADGNEAVVDFKYAGRNKYKDKLAEGKAVQLAVYSEARRRESGREGRLEGTGYLIFRNAHFFTPEGRALRGSTSDEMVAGAPDIFDVWYEFEEALVQGGDWLEEGGAVSARPLQSPEERPPGAQLVIEDDSGRPRGELDPCKYCDYDTLCGLKQHE